MTKRATLTTGVCILIAVVAGLFATGGEAVAGRGDGGVIYVTSQGLYYDTFATADPLPPHGRFQELEMDAPPGADGQTAYGPGDPGYLGGRWWVDVNGNDEMDEMDHYFLCPLLGPGRDAP
jgi:hypothetical protein